MAAGALHDDSPIPASSADETSPLLGRHDGSANDVRTGGDVESHRTDEDEARNHDTDAPTHSELSDRQLAVILGSVYVGVFLSALDATIIATLTGPISTTFKSLSLLSWLASAYLISNAAFQPLSGRLTDIFSRRAGLIVSNVFFALGNLLCGLATTQWAIIVGRVVAGVGGGGLTAIATFVASDHVPLRKRGVVQGLGNLCYGLGAGLGGVFGGWVNDTWGWRFAFLAQVPLTTISAVAVFFLVPGAITKVDKSPFKRVDFLGAITLVVSLVLFLLAVNSGGNTVAWTHPLVLVSLPLSAMCFAFFIYVEDKRAAEPIIPVRLLLHRTVAAACLINWFLTMAVFGFLFYGPIYFQIRGLTTTQAGARLIPQSVGSATGSLGVGLIMKATGRYYLLNLGVESIFLLAAVLISTFTLTTPAWVPFIYFFLGGVGYGGMLTITLLALISAVDHAHQAVITSASYAFRSTGSTLGVTITSAVFQNTLKLRLWATFGDRKDAAQIIARVRDSLDEIARLPPDWRPGVLDCYMLALRAVFLTTLSMAVLGCVASWFMREHTLHATLARK